MAIAAVLVVYLIIIMFFSALAVVSYILTSLSIFTVAKRRGIRAPGLAWVPVANVWTLGSICDHYEAAHGVQRKWRVVLLTLAVITFICALFAYLIVLLNAINVAMTYSDFDAAFNYLRPNEMVGLLDGGIVLLIVGAIAATALSVFEMICLFKFYRSCRPKDAVKFLLLSLFVPFAEPVCLLLCRNSDDGMKATDG